MKSYIIYINNTTLGKLFCYSVQGRTLNSAKNKATKQYRSKRLKGTMNIVDSLLINTISLEAL